MRWNTAIRLFFPAWSDAIIAFIPSPGDLRHRPSGRGAALVGRNTESNSGFSGAESLAFALNAQGQLWAGTQSAGVDIFRMEH